MLPLPPIPELAADASYAAFASFVSAGVPVVARGLCDDWPLRRAVTSPADGSLDLAALVARFGDAEVPVVAAGGAGYGSDTRAVMPLDSYVRGLREGEGVSCSAAPYAKDWHIARTHPASHGYAVPLCVAADWLNSACDALGGDDYRFAYLGPPASSTPLHHDVLATASWSVNVAGRKLWVFAPPAGSRAALYDSFGGLRWGTLLTASERAALGAALACALPGGEDGEDPPGLAGALAGLGRSLCVQAPGDLVFVPPGWHHEVVNVGPGPTLSLNHNWFAGGGAPAVWEFLASEAAAVRAAIGDLREGMGEGEWAEHVQRMLRANNGGVDLDGWGRLVAGRAAALLRQTAVDGETVNGDGAADFSGLDVAQPGTAGLMLPVLAAPHVRLPPAETWAELRAAAGVLRELLCDPHFARRGHGRDGGVAPGWPPYPGQPWPGPVTQQDGVTLDATLLLAAVDAALRGAEAGAGAKVVA